MTRNGRVVASISEERLTRRKNEVGYPRHSVEEALRIGGVDAKDLHQAVYASLFMHGTQYLTNLEPWYRLGLADQHADALRPKDYQPVIFEQRKRERTGELHDHLGIEESRIGFIEHHLCHLAGAYYTAPNARPGTPVLGFTCDGAGDNISGSVSVCKGNDIERLVAISRHASLGKIYSRVTMLMGMTPWEHEYKLMGLAPYAELERAKATADSLRGLIRLSNDGLVFEQVGELSMNYSYEHLRECFEGVRFDIIAGATQLFAEEILTDWVRAAIRKTGISNIVCGGGVFMNVKANMLIAQLPEVTSMYVMPSAADESLSIGACLHRYYELSGEIDHAESVFEDLYFGPRFDRRAEERAIAEATDGLDLEVVESNDIDTAVADMLAEGKVVARCAGRMEWGARALGNRSILASADDYRVVDRINQAIKKRDFWMPFAPSIRAESAPRYLDDPKNLTPYFMMHAFPARPQGRAELVAGSHPRDHTIRPQIVTKDCSPDYYKILHRFEERTGRGAILNTSFNLHGFPIVNSPQDAMGVFAESGLEHLALNHFMISRRQVEA